MFAIRAVKECARWWTASGDDAMTAPVLQLSVLCLTVTAVAAVDAQTPPDSKSSLSTSEEC